MTATAADPTRAPAAPAAQRQHRLADAPAPLVGVGVFLVLFVIYAATAAYSTHQANDTASALVPAWQYANHGNLTLDHFAGTSPWFVPAHGRLVSNRTPGVIFFGVPFYWLAGHTPKPTYYPAGIAAAFAAAMAMTLLFLLFRRVAGQRVALAGTAVAAFATCTWSVSADALWPHGPDQLWIALGLLLVASQRRWVAGLAYGAGILTRPHLAVVAAATGLGEAIRRRSIWPAVQVGVGAGVGVAALYAYNQHVFATAGGGYPAGANGDVAGTSHLLVNIAGTLVSPERGVLVLSPFLLLLLPGLRRGWSVAPSWVRSSAVGGLLYLAVQLWHNGFTGGEGFFGYRLPLEALTAAAPLLLLCYTQWTALGAMRRRAFAALVALSVAMQSGGAIFRPLGYAPPAHGARDPWTTFMPAWSLHSMAYVALLGVTVGAGVVGWRWRRLAGAELPQCSRPLFTSVN